MTLLDGLVAHWKLDEESGDRLDSSGNGHTLRHADYSGDPTAVAGKLGMGITEGVLETANTFDVADGFTVAGWVRDAGLEDGDRIVLLSVSGVGVDDICTLNFRYNFRAHFDIAGVDLSYPEAISDLLTADEWHLLIASWEKGTGLYLWADDGAPVFAPFTGENIANDYVTPAFMKSDSAGQILDSVSFWSRVLTSDERTQLWNNGDGLDYEDFAPVANGGSSSSAPATMETVLRVNRPVPGRELWIARPIDRSPKKGF